jgi:hypothetical protein
MQNQTEAQTTAAIAECDAEVPISERDERTVADKLQLATFPILGVGMFFAPLLVKARWKDYTQCLEGKGYTLTVDKTFQP